jgi:nitrogen fixation-related uncharacterized protein
MFVPVWLFFLATGTLMALLVLSWAIRTGQFEDQDRARYLPLCGLPDAEPGLRPPARRRIARLGVLAILASGAVALASTLWVVLRHAQL